MGVAIISPDLRLFFEALRFEIKTSNNEAKYEAMIAKVRMAKGLGISRLIVRSDSQLVVNQINCTYRTKAEMMDGYL